MAALRLIETQLPDIAVLDLNLCDLHTLELVRRVREADLSTRIVVLSTRRDRKTVVEALRCSVNGFLLKSAPWNQLIEAFDQVLDGGVYVSPELELNGIFCATGDNGNTDPLEALSAREHQVFSLLVEGVRAKEIAARLELSPKTVDTLPRQPNAKARHSRRGWAGKVRDSAGSDVVICLMTENTVAREIVDVALDMLRPRAWIVRERVRSRHGDQTRFCIPIGGRGCRVPLASPIR
jgi:DNA-binding NarL/FixJ family response regulator